jgi:hypothetical protein
MVETTNNGFHSTIKATNHWLPFINCSNVTMIFIQQWKQEIAASIQQ